MKILRHIGLSVVIMALAAFSIQCGKGAESASGEMALLKMLPENANGFVLFNFKKVAELGLFETLREKMKEENVDKGTEAYKAFDQFVTQTGFNPEKDLHSGAMALFGDLDSGKPQMAFVLQGNIEPEKMAAFAKEKNPELKEESVNGVPLYQIEKTGEEDMALCFPKTGLALMGQIEVVKKTIGVINGQGKSLMDSQTLTQYKPKATPGALLTAVILIPEKARSMQEKMTPPFEFDLSKAEAFTAELFYGDETWSGSLVLVSDNPEGNKKNANTLNMLKNMGVMLGPEVGEVLNGLSFNPGDKQLEIKFSITKAQLEKLGQKAKEAIPTMSEETPADPTME